jgi:hypothetical protein
VNEAYMRLVDYQACRVAGPGPFFAVSAATDAAHLGIKGMGQ